MVNKSKKMEVNEMTKPNIINGLDLTFSSSKNKLKKEENVKSKPLIIFGFIISLTSIFLLLFTINNRFG